MIERLLRTLQRLGYSRATVFTDTPAVSAHVAEPSWARTELAVQVSERPNELSIADVRDAMGSAGRALIVNGEFCLDARLLRAVAELPTPTILEGAACVSAEWLRGFEDASPVAAALELGCGVVPLDLATVPTYVVSMRRDVPLCFIRHAPRDEAERLILDSAQNGTLDFPALIHAPIETAIVARLCRTSVTPNQVTLVTLLLGLSATWLFAAGQLGWGTLVALVVGVLDGVDGKLARVKVETTPLGGWEHSFDYLVEFSWWGALAWHFWRSGALPEAPAFFLALLVTDWLGRIAKARVKRRLGRNLDDVSPFDRRVRYVAGRRNIYVWIFAVGLLLRCPANAFIALCFWGGISAAIHALRALLLCRAVRQPEPAQAQVG